MMNLLLIVLFSVICNVSSTYYYQHPLLAYINFDQYKNLKLPQSPSINTDGALFLTPYLENGDIAGAQRAARVYLSKAPNVTSYGGFFTTNKKYNSNVYFRYFVAENNPDTAPLISLNQGGPGYSLELSILGGTGPYELADDLSYIFQDCRWMKNAHVVYFDYPFGAGFSFLNDSAGYPTSKEQYGEDMYSALMQFYALFPHLLNRNYYAFGRGYGAKFVTVLAKYIDIHNTQKSNIPIPLKGLILESPYIDPSTAFNHSQHLYQLGLIDKNGRAKFQNQEAQCRNLINQKQYEQATDVCLSIIDNIIPKPTIFKRLTGYNNIYNIEQTSTDDKENQKIIASVTSPEKRKALHVGNVEFDLNAKIIYRTYMKSDYTQSVIPILNDVIQKYRILYVNGMQDLMFLYPLLEVVIDNMNYPGKESYSKADRKIFMVNNEIAGYVKSSNKMTHALIRNAGYNVANKQRCWSYHLITDFIQNKI